jgi:predicted metal-dependent phosphotriesterase family hydrolase
MSDKLVQTTLGPLPAGKLGWINAHEHLFVDHGHGAYKEPDFKLDDVAKTTEEVIAWRDAGGGAMVDTMPPGAGRNVDKCIEVSKATGIPIILPTGFHKNYYYFPDHWRFSYDEDEMFDLVLAECIEGVDRRNYLGPLIKRSTVKAGTIKVADYYNRIEPNMLKCIRVVGRVHQKTGLPVYVHTEATPPFEIIQRLLDAGVPAQSILICHLDRNPDFWLHKKVANLGVFLEYDTPSRFKYQPECKVVELMRQMIDEGFGDRLCLGGDLARRSYLPAYGGGPGYKYLLTVFTPRLLDEGFSEAEINAIWHENPARWLTNGL